MSARRAKKLTELIPTLLHENEARRRAAEAGQLRGPITNLGPLDAELDILPAGTTILQGGPGVGKTSAGLQFASDCGFPALVVTAEMAAVPIFHRLIARQTSTFLSKIRAGTLATAELSRLAQATAQGLSRLEILDASLEPANVDVVKQAASELLESSGVTTLLVVIDSLQCWARAGAFGGPVTEYDLITGGMFAARALATELSAPVLLISHRSRAGQERGGLYASKGSGDIEYGSEIVLELSRGGEAQFDSAGEAPVALTILKNRYGQAPITIPLRFSGRLQSFRDASGEMASLNPATYTGGRRKKT